MSGDKEESNDVTLWIRSMENGNHEAASELWEYCFPKLLKYSRGKLPNHLRRALDEEDVALSAFKSFYLRANRGDLGPIDGRDELWKLLYCITARKALGYVRHQTREKRGGGLVQGESIFAVGSDPESRGNIDEFAADAITPALRAEFADQCQHLLAMLDDDVLETIALLRVEGYSVDEIASRVGCAKRSVERRLKLIRTIWLSADQDEPENHE